MWTADSDLDYNDYFNPKDPAEDEEPTEAERDQALAEEAGDRAYDAMPYDEEEAA